MNALGLTIPLLVLASALLATPPAFGLNVTSSAVKGLSQAYGFLIGQDHTLQRISIKYPELIPLVDLSRARFAAAFPDVKALEAHLRAALGPENFDEFAKKTLETVRATLDRHPLAADTATDFLEQVQARARGEIEPPVLEYLLTVKYASNPVREYTDGFRQRFSTDGSGKTRGIKLSLQLPRSWVAQDGERPHIVKKWTSEGGTGLEILTLDIRDAEGYDPDRDEIDRFLRSGEVKQTVPPGGVHIASGPFTVERRPGYWIEMKVTHERVGVEMYQRIVMYQVFLRGRAIGIMCQAVGSPRDAAKIDESLKRIRPLCHQVVNSMVLHQSW